MKRAVVHLIAGARPNFMKVAPLWHAFQRSRDIFDVALIHTGQHYDDEMSDVFLRQFGLPTPDFHLGAGAGSHAEQTAAVMIAYERVCLEKRPDWIVVVGDVNSTLAATLVGKKLGIAVAHLEAGLRSFDRTMPEEINRLVTDSIADLLWTPSPDGDENLAREGVASGRVERVGNIMIDSFELVRKEIAKANIPAQFGLVENQYGVVTLHRPSNVDDPQRLSALVDALAEASRKIALILPLHPRTRRRLEEGNLLASLTGLPGLQVTKSLGYIEFMSLVSNARFVLTDSGGVQEETTYLQIPCLTLRDSTERPVTITSGSNRLVKLENLNAEIERVSSGPLRVGNRPDLWDGSTADRVVGSLRKRLGV